HLDELTPKMRENFEKFGDRLPIARQLVTLKTDVNFNFDPAACLFAGLNMPALQKHLRECGFTSLLKRLGDDATGVTPQAPTKTRYQPFSEGLFGPMGESGAASPQAEGPAPQTCADCSYECVDTDEKFEIFLDLLKQQKRFAFDTETVGLGAVHQPLVGMSFSWKHATGYYVPIRGPAGCKLVDCDRILRELKPILENAKINKVGHNLKYDLLVMRQAGVHVRGVSMDSMIAAFLIDAGRMRFGIDQLALDLLNFRKIPTIDLIGKGRNQLTMDRVPLEKISCYAAEDADIALRLCDLMEKKLESLPRIRQLAEDIEVPLIDVLVEMENNGIAVEPAILSEQSKVLGERIDTLREQIVKEAGCEFNPDSPKQLSDVLFN